MLVTYQFGDTWTLANLRSVFLAGMIGTSVPALLLFFFDDDQTLGGISEVGLGLGLNWTMSGHV